MLQKIAFNILLIYVGQGIEPATTSDWCTGDNDYPIAVPINHDDVLKFGGASQHCKGAELPSNGGVNRFSNTTATTWGCREACLNVPSCTHYTSGPSPRWGHQGDCLLYGGSCSEGEGYHGDPVKTYQINRQASACAPLDFHYNSVNLTATGACAFTGTDNQAIAKCEGVSSCAGLVEVATATTGTKFLAFQKPQVKRFHFLKGRPGSDKYSCNRRLGGDDSSIDSSASPGRNLLAMKASAAGWCTANNDFVTMLPASVDSSCAVHTSGSCMWSGLSNAKANCERIPACSGIVDNSDDEWLAYNGVEVFHIFYRDSSSSKSLAYRYSDCKRRLLGKAVGAQDRTSDGKVPLMLEDKSEPTVTTTIHVDSTSATTKQADSTATTTTIFLRATTTRGASSAVPHPSSTVASSRSLVAFVLSCLFALN